MLVRQSFDRPMKTRTGKYISAPVDGPMQSGDITGVYIREDEEVEWVYLNSRIVGFVVRKKIDTEGIFYDIHP